MRFEWDPNKEKKNQKDHGVSFYEARMVFADSFMLSMFDHDHSDDEDRWVTLGDSGNKLLVVIHTYRTTKDGESVRIISARKATAGESSLYLQRRNKA